MPAALHAVVDAARAHANAPRGARTLIVQQLADTLNVSLQTAYTQLKRAQGLRDRQQRIDAGASALTRDEAVQLVALIEATRRETGTGALTLGDAVAILRERVGAFAGRLDETTGEWRPLSLSAISKALRAYRMHPEQIAGDTAATRLSSPHPNYCWQIDASVSRQFYLAPAGGTKSMPRMEFYRGKPGNFARIADQRLWRYAITDHCSGCIDVMYVLGAESTANLLTALMYVMAQRPDSIMHGVPQYLMSDGGALNAAATFNFLAALNIQPVVNAPGNARAKGQVECAHNLIERHFEAPLKLGKPIDSLEQINRLASRWARHFNSTAIHTRHGLTRRDAWLRISTEQLVFAPSLALMQQLPMSNPQQCTVRDLAIKFKGQVYEVRDMPGVMNGSRVDVVINPFDAHSVRVITREQGRLAYYLAPMRRYDDWGFDAGAARIGVEHKAMPATPADAARKEIERVAMEVDTDTAAAAARKAKRVPFGGTIDPGATWKDPAPHVPRAGTASDVSALPRIEPAGPAERPRYEPRRFSWMETVRELMTRVEQRGGTWTPEHYAQAQARWPEGLTEDEFDAAAQSLMRPTLRAITGGAA